MMPNKNLLIRLCFDPTTREWKVLQPLPTARGGLAAAAVRNKIHVFGGEQPTSTFGEHEIYDPETDTWSVGPTMPTPRHGLAAATLNNRIYVVAGGPNPGGSYSNINEVFVQ